MLRWFMLRLRLYFDYFWTVLKPDSRDCSILQHWGYARSRWNRLEVNAGNQGAYSRNGVFTLTESTKASKNTLTIATIESQETAGESQEVVWAKIYRVTVSSVTWLQLTKQSEDLLKSALRFTRNTWLTVLAKFFWKHPFVSICNYSIL